MRKLLLLSLPLLLPLVLPITLGACTQAKPDMPQLVLQPILFPDFAPNKLYGPSCNFVPANGGMGAVFMAQESRAVIKIDDHIVTIPLAGDAGPLPHGTHTHYAGPLYAATLVPAPDGKPRAMGAATVFASHLTITDAKRQTVYDANGDTQCRPG